MKDVDDILTTFFNIEGFRDEIMDKVRSNPNRCRIRGYEKYGVYCMEVQMPPEWVADFND